MSRPPSHPADESDGAMSTKHLDAFRRPMAFRTADAPKEYPTTASRLPSIPGQRLEHVDGRPDVLLLALSVVDSPSLSPTPRKLKRNDASPHPPPRGIWW